MKRRSVVWCPAAIEDVDSIIERLRSLGSHVNAERALDRIDRAVASLRVSATRGRSVAEFAVRGITQYRELIVPPWRIVYRVEPARVRLLTVVDTRRQLDELLLARLVRVD